MRLPAFFAAVLFCLGCPGPTPRMADLQREVFTPSCTFSTCHRSGVAAGGLTLDENPYSQLVGVGSLGAPQRIRVVPFDLKGSYLYDKLTMAKPEVGDQMPPTGPAEAHQVELIRRWIVAGATAD